MEATTRSNMIMVLFDEAAGLDGDRRAQFLASRCDDTVRSEIESLLRAYDSAAGFLDDPNAEKRELHDHDPYRAGTRIGHYELLDLLGEGGFAQVFRARQSHPVRREVAVKIIKPGMDTRAVIARFELERQALAMMDHPSIAAVYDAGTTDRGRPFFVMELVRGQRITRFADDANLGVRDRVRLCIDVCNAVHHAHQKGVLHRDLKPSNLLVTTVNEGPLPKIIDFGIAKATQSGITESTFATGERQLLGTPQYMSPEQAITGGADVDTRSDVYSLGAVLYELLTGVPPLGPTSGVASVFEQLQRLTSDHEIAPPSSRAEGSRRGELQGDLDAIVLKCLSHDRAERYDSAAALATDLRAFLEHRPIAATPPGAIYRARKFVRRNTVAVSAAGAVALALVIGTAVSLTQAFRAHKAERLAQARLEETQAVNDFLMQDVLAAPNPIVARANREMTVREALDNAAKGINEKFKDRPLSEAAVREMIAWSYKSLSRADLALPHADRSLEQRRQLLGDDHPDTLRALSVRAAILMSLQRHAEAEPLYKDLVDRTRRVLGDDDEQTINALGNYANAVMARGRWADAEVLSRRAAAEARRALGPGHMKTVVTMCEHALILEKLGRFAEAEPIVAEAYDLSLKHEGADYPGTISAMGLHAKILKDLGRYAEAERLSKEVLVRRRQVYGEDSGPVLSTMQENVLLLTAMGRGDEARTAAEELLAASRRIYGPDHPEAITNLNNYAMMILNARPREAEPMLAEVLERRRRVQGEDHPETINAMSSYALALQRVGRTAEAEPLMLDALGRSRRVIGDAHWRTLLVTSFYADVLIELGRDAEAAPLCESLYAKRDTPGLTPDSGAVYTSQYGRSLQRLGRHAEAEPPLRESCDRWRKLNLASTPRAMRAFVALAEVYEHLGRSDDATKLRDEIKQLRDRASASTRPSTKPSS